MASALSKILQKGILIILERIFEPTFRNGSHGFSALIAVVTLHCTLFTANKLGTPRFMEAGFVQCSDRISHNKLLIAINGKV